MDTKKRILPILLAAGLIFSQCEALEDLVDAAEATFTDESEYPGEYSLTAEQSERYDSIAEEYPDEENRLLKLAAYLELSDEQIELLSPVMEDLHTELKALHDEMKAAFDAGEKPGQETMEALHDQMKALKETAREEIREILDDEQNEAFDELVAECERNREGKGPHGPPPNHENRDL